MTPGTPPPAPTPAPTLTPRYAYVHLDIPDARIAICEGLAPVLGTVPPPLSGCVDVRPRSDVTPGAAGDQYILYASDVFRYRIYRTSPGWCEPQVVVVTATPPPTDTPTLTITPNAIATYVAGTLTALAPTPTGTPTIAPTSRPTDTRAPTPLPEATPTAARVYRLLLFPMLQHRPVPPTVRPR